MRYMRHLKKECEKMQKKINFYEKLSNVQELTPEQATNLANLKINLDVISSSMVKMKEKTNVRVK